MRIMMPDLTHNSFHGMSDHQGVSFGIIHSKFDKYQIRMILQYVPFCTEHTAAYDYVIKRYLTECYELRNNTTSKYYNTPYGKPAIIVLCTHWHDCRTVYNESIRKLAAKWGVPLIEFDKYIGFSKNVLHPVTGKPFSQLYSTDIQVTEGIAYGHHPIRGEQSYMQQRMAAIFVDLMTKILPIKY